MKILIIGGTKFSGRHLVRALIENEHEVTIFHRGNHPTDDLEDVEEILGDRIFDLDKLKGRVWDVVIDMCGYLPQWVEMSAEVLQDAAEKYVFISSVSAYADFSQPDFDESTALARLTPEQEIEFAKIDPQGEFNAAALGEMYGALKVLCEEEVLRQFPENNLIIRPGLIVGEYDFTDRFTYWVMRVERGGEMLAPGDPESFVQFIDAKDLARWIVRLIEDDARGIYNAVGQPFRLTFGQMLATIREVCESDAQFTWVSEEFLRENEVAPWSDLPLYIPSTDDELKNLETANVAKAVSAGLTFRELGETVTDILRWRRTISEEMRAGISLEREKELLDKWHRRPT